MTLMILVAESSDQPLAFLLCILALQNDLSALGRFAGSTLAPNSHFLGVDEGADLPKSQGDSLSIEGQLLCSLLRKEPRASADSVEPDLVCILAKDEERIVRKRNALCGLEAGADAWRG